MMTQLPVLLLAGSVTALEKWHIIQMVVSATPLPTPGVTSLAPGGPIKFTPSSTMPHKYMCAYTYYNTPLQVWRVIHILHQVLRWCSQPGGKMMVILAGKTA